MLKNYNLKFSIIIPVYNEDKNIKNLFAEIINSLKLYTDYEIIFINDCSNDNTFEVLKSLKSDRVILYNNKRNMGQSFSLYRGIENSNHNIILSIDGDGQNNPKDIPVLIEKYSSDKNIKLVAGIRVNRKDNLIKIYSSKIANFVRSSIFDDNCPDTGCSLKVFDKDIFLKFPYFDGIHRFIPSLFRSLNAKTVFVNVDHRERVHGKSNYGTISRMLKGIIDIIKVKKIIKNLNFKND